jgi:hypothetical protein
VSGLRRPMRGDRQRQGVDGYREALDALKAAMQ